VKADQVPSFLQKPVGFTHRVGRSQLFDVQNIAQHRSPRRRRQTAVFLNALSPFLLGGCGVAVQPAIVSVHGYPPVGPKRSVLTRTGSCPSCTNPAAAVSTNWVDPQM